MLNFRNNKGITLIALVITIIVLLILAGITIMQLTKSGLFDNANKAKESHTLAAQQEELEMEIANLKMQMLMDYNNSNTQLNDLKDYLESSKFNGEYEVELFYEPLAATSNVSSKPILANVTHLPTKFSFVVDGKLVVLGGKAETNVEQPKIADVKTVIIGESIRVDVDLRNGQGVTLKYSIQKDTDENEGEEQSSNIFNNLEKETTYVITVKATNDKGLNLVKRVKTTVTEIKELSEPIITLNATAMATGQNITAEVTHLTGQVEIAVENCKYLVNTNSRKIGINAAEWNDATAFTTNPQTVSIAQNTAGTYYLHVLSVDSVGNKKEAVSSAFRILQSQINFQWDRGVFTPVVGTGVNVGYSRDYGNTMGTTGAGITSWVISTTPVNVDEIETISLSPIDFYGRWTPACTIKFGIGTSPDDKELTYYKSEDLPQNSWKIVSFTINKSEISNLTGNYYIKLLMDEGGNNSGSKTFSSIIFTYTK